MRNHKINAQNFSGKISENFSWEISWLEKKYFVQTSFCRRATLKHRVHTKRVVQQHASERVVRRFSTLEAVSEKVLRRVLIRCLAVGFKRRQGSEKGS